MFLVSKRLFLVISTLVFFATPCFANAPGMEDTDHLKQVAKDFVMKAIPAGKDETIEVQVSQLQSGMQFPVCSKTIDTAFPNGSNTESVTAVELSCNGDRPWHTFLPVTVKHMIKVLVASRMLQGKDILGANDVEYATYDRNTLFTGYLTATDDAVGQEATHLITAGTVLNKHNIESPLLVMRNQIVDLIAKKNAMVISMKGIAKSDGRLNDPIKVYNPSSKRLIDAVVVGSGKAETI